MRVPEAPESRPEGLLALWSRLLSALAELTVRRPWLLVALGLLSLAPAVVLAGRLTLKSSFIDLLSASDPEVRDLTLVLDKTGGLGFSTIAVEAKERARAEEFASTLAVALEKTEGVKFVQARLDIEFIEDHQLYLVDKKELEELTLAVKESIDHRIQRQAGMLLDDDEAPPPDPLEKIKARVKQQNLELSPFVVGSDGAYLYMFVALAGSVGDLDQTAESQQRVERLTTELAAQQSPPIAVRFTGPVVNRLADAQSLTEDLTKAGMLGFGGVILMVLLGTRRLRSMVLLGLPLGVGLCWTFAFAYLAVSHLNAVSGFLASILSGLGIEYGIHLIRRYGDERAEGKSPEDATRIMLVSTGGALLGACLVNAAVFAVVAVAGFRGFTEFGLIASVGMLLTMGATLLLFPAINLLWDRRFPVIRGVAAEPRPLRFGRILPRAVFAFTLVALAYSITALGQGRVRFHTDWRELGADTPSAQFDQYVVKTLSESVTQVLLYLEDPTEVEKVRSAVQKVRASRKAQGLDFNVLRVVGIDDLVPEDQEAKRVALDALATQLERVRVSKLSEDDKKAFVRAQRMVKALPFTAEEVPRSLKQRFLTADGVGTMAVITSDALLEDSEKLIDWSNQMQAVREELAEEGVRGALASENAIAGRIFRIITESGGRILGATFLVVFFVLYLEFRRFSHALVVLSSVALGMLMVGGGMSLFGVELNFMNAAVLPIVVGVSLDNAIHIFHRFLEDGPRAIPSIMRSTGAAALLSSATNMAGFAALLVARHGGLRSVASLAVLGIFATVFTTTLVFPLLLDAWGKRKRSTGRTQPDES